MDTASMDTASPFSAKIEKMLQANTAMPLKQLRKALSARSRSSFFRDLKKLNLVTSFTHTGQYHALESALKYDNDGLWFHNHAGFSKFGTLKSTLIRIISDAQAGMTQKELKKMLRINVQNTLTELVKVNAIERQQISRHIYLYLSIEEPVRTEQVRRRLILTTTVPENVLPPESITIEILVEVIRFSSCFVNEKELGHRLRKRGIMINDAEVEYVLNYYDIKKNRL